jgi:hypothetical protein
MAFFNFIRNLFCLIASINKNLNNLFYYFMKKYLVLLLLSLTFVSCDFGEDDSPKFHLELLPIESATLPVEFKRDSVYELPISFIRPTGCHVFDGFYYEKDMNKRTIAIQTSVIEQSSCGDAPVNPLTKMLNFKPTIENSYIFRLWKGKDTNGVDVFEEIEIPVVP